MQEKNSLNRAPLSNVGDTLSGKDSVLLEPFRESNGARPISESTSLRGKDAMYAFAKGSSSAESGSTHTSLPTNAKIDTRWDLDEGRIVESSIEEDPRVGGKKPQTLKCYRCASSVAVGSEARFETNDGIKVVCSSCKLAILDKRQEGYVHHRSHSNPSAASSPDSSPSVLSASSTGSHSSHVSSSSTGSIGSTGSTAAAAAAVSGAKNGASTAGPGAASSGGPVVPGSTNVTTPTGANTRGKWFKKASPSPEIKSGAQSPSHKRRSSTIRTRDSISEEAGKFSEATLPTKPEVLEALTNYTANWNVEVLAEEQLTTVMKAALREEGCARCLRRERKKLVRIPKGKDEQEVQPETLWVAMTCKLLSCQHIMHSSCAVALPATPPAEALHTCGNIPRPHLSTSFFRMLTFTQTAYQNLMPQSLCLDEIYDDPPSTRCCSAEFSFSHVVSDGKMAQAVWENVATGLDSQSSMQVVWISAFHAKLKRVFTPSDALQAGALSPGGGAIDPQLSRRFSSGSNAPLSNPDLSRSSSYNTPPGSTTGTAAALGQGTMAASISAAAAGSASAVSPEPGAGPASPNAPGGNNAAYYVSVTADPLAGDSLARGESVPPSPSNAPPGAGSGSTVLAFTLQTPLPYSASTSAPLTERGVINVRITDHTDPNQQQVWTHSCNYDVSTVPADARHIKMISVDSVTGNNFVVGLNRALTTRRHSLSIISATGSSLQEGDKTNEELGGEADGELEFDEPDPGLPELSLAYIKCELADVIPLRGGAAAAGPQAQVYTTSPSPLLNVRHGGGVGGGVGAGPAPMMYRLPANLVKRASLTSVSSGVTPPSTGSGPILTTLPPVMYTPPSTPPPGDTSPLLNRFGRAQNPGVVVQTPSSGGSLPRVDSGGFLSASMAASVVALSGAASPSVHPMLLNGPFSRGGGSFSYNLDGGTTMGLGVPGERRDSVTLGLGLGGGAPGTPTAANSRRAAKKLSKLKRSSIISTESESSQSSFTSVNSLGETVAVPGGASFAPRVRPFGSQYDQVVPPSPVLYATQAPGVGPSVNPALQPLPRRMPVTPGPVAGPVPHTLISAYPSAVVDYGGGYSYSYQDSFQGYDDRGGRTDGYFYEVSSPPGTPEVYLTHTSHTPPPYSPATAHYASGGYGGGPSGGGSYYVPQGSPALHPHAMHHAHSLSQGGGGAPPLHLAGPAGVNGGGGGGGFGPSPTLGPHAMPAHLLHTHNPPPLSISPAAPLHFRGGSAGGNGGGGGRLHNERVPSKGMFKSDSPPLGDDMPLHGGNGNGNGYGGGGNGGGGGGGHSLSGGNMALAVDVANPDKIRNLVVALLKNPQGCTLIQKQLASRVLLSRKPSVGMEKPAPDYKTAEAERWLSECIKGMSESVSLLMTDSCAQHTVGRIIGLCDDTQLSVIVRQLAPHLAAVCCHKVGTFAVQNLIKFLDGDKEGLDLGLGVGVGGLAGGAGGLTPGSANGGNGGAAAASSSSSSLSASASSSSAVGGTSSPGGGSGGGGGASNGKDFSPPSPALVTFTQALRVDLDHIVLDKSGHFVVLQFLQRFKYAQTKIVDECMLAHTETLLRDKYGLHVFRELIKARQGSPSLLTPLFQKVVTLTSHLVYHQFGNFVLQCVLECGADNVKESLFTSLAGSYQRLSANQFSSLVVERCLKSAPDGSYWRSIIIQEMCEEPGVGELLNDRYGNYVLQTALSLATVQQVKFISQHIVPHLDILSARVRRKWQQMLQAASQRELEPAMGASRVGGVDMRDGGRDPRDGGRGDRDVLRGDPRDTRDLRDSRDGRLAFDKN